MVEVDTVLLKVASRCNIDCRYCYVFNMGDTGWSREPKQMSRETHQATAAALARLAREQGRPFAVVLHGGEPLLLGAANLDHVISTLREALPAECAISIQTNGILIRREILDLCAGARVTLSVSLDGPRHVHDRNRVGFAGQGTFDK
ncbi:MAG: radical SAM protein, partial [Gammaproteobacteria bacterium]